MALGDPIEDPALAAQLYGIAAPDLTDMAPPPTTVEPWSWVPAHWDTPDDDQLRHLGAAPQTPAAAGNMLPGEVAAPELGPPPANVGPEAPPAPLPITALPSFAAPGPIPAPAPDALTGAGGMPQAGELGGVPYAPTLTPAQTREQLVTQYGDNPLAIPDPALREQYLNALAQRDPQKFAEVMLRHEEEKRKALDTRRIEMLNRDYDDQVANLKARQEADRVTQEKMTAVLADAQRIASTKIDPTGGLSGGRAIAGVLGAVIGGLVQGKTGSARNAGMDALNDTINRGIDAQKADLENQRAGLGFRRSILGDEFARHGNEFQATEAIRLAAYKHADDLLASEQQNYDPQGTMALKIAATRAGIAAQQQTATQAFAQKTFENELKVQDARRQQQLADIERQKLGVEYAKLDVERGKQKADNTVLSPQQIREQFPEFPASAIPPKGATIADLVKRAELANKGQEFKNQSLETTNAIPGVTVKTPDGQEKPFVAVGKSEELAKVRGKVAASSTIVHLLDEAQRIRTGYSNNNLGNRKEWLQLKQIWGAAKAKGKDSLGLGALSADDYKLLNEYLGAEDPTSFRDPTEGIKQARLTVMQDLNDTLGSVGYKGRYEIPDTSKPPAVTDTAEDKLKKMVAGKPSDAKPSPFAPIDPDVHTAAPPTPRDIEIEREYPGMARVQRDALELWAGQLQGNDPAARDRAAENLAEMAGLSKELPGATDAAVRAYARDLLVRNIRPFSAPSEDTTTSTSSLRAITGQSQGAEPPVSPPPDWRLP